MNDTPRRVATTAIPILLLASLGTFSWAIRGQSGFGAVPGCVFAGLAWGMAWFWLGREPGEEKQRRYGLGWSVLAITVGVGLGGMHGWAQWPNWVQGQFHVDWPSTFLPIDPAVGYAWIFIAGAPWAGMGAVFLAWTGSKRSLPAKHWLARIGCGLAGGGIAWLLYLAAPGWFLPYYGTVDYADPACVQCPRAAHDNWVALVWFGLYLGFLCYEIAAKDWMNVKLITIVGVIAGLSWMVFQFWHFMDEWFPGVPLNWWRGWEATGGLGFGAAFGIAFVACNKPLPGNHPGQRLQPFSTHRNLESLIGVNLAVLVGMMYVVSSGIKGYLNIYHGIDETLVGWVLPLGVLGAGWWLASAITTGKAPFTRGDGRDSTAGFPAILAIAYAVHRVVGLQVTGPLDIGAEIAFFASYIALAGLDVILAWAWTRTAPASRA